MHLEPQEFRNRRGNEADKVHPPLTPPPDVGGYTSTAILRLRKDGSIATKMHKKVRRTERFLFVDCRASSLQFSGGWERSFETP